MKALGWPISLLLISIFVSFLATVSGSETTIRGSFGDFCNKTLRCNSREFLTCLNETCHCLKSDGMMFESETNSCVTLAGESCRYTVFSNSDGGSQDSKSWTEEIKCLKNAQCNSEGTCDCDSNFFELGNGTCQPKGIYGDKCKSDVHCRADLKFKCLEGGTCNCDPDLAIFSSDEKSCVGLAEKACISGKCVPGASECDNRQHIPNPNYNNGYYGRSRTIANPRHNLCKCNEGTVISTQGLCLVPHSGKCKPSYPDSNCLPSLKCQDGTCVCPNQDYQYIDTSLQTCITLVGGPCGPTDNNSLAIVTSSTSQRSSWDSRCVDLAICSEDGDEAPNCKCTHGFVPNAERKCELGFGSTCSHDIGLVCGKRQGLFCINGLCACKDDLRIYDPVVSECRGLVDSLCSETEGPSCVEGARCLVPKRTWRKTGDGTCVCDKNQGFLFNPRNRTCYKDTTVAAVTKFSLIDRRRSVPAHLTPTDLPEADPKDIRDDGSGLGDSLTFAMPQLVMVEIEGSPDSSE